VTWPHGLNRIVMNDLRYIAEKYGHNRWLIRDLKAKGNDNISAYPGPSLANVAASWLKFEAGANGDRIQNLDEFSGLVSAAEARIVAQLEEAYEHEIG